MEVDLRRLLGEAAARADRHRGPPGAVAIRDATQDDLAFVREMLYEALMWNPAAERYPFEFVLAHPEVTRYHEGWGRQGDVALVAEDGGRPIGAVWFRLFTEDDHGEGYVDDATPEVAIGVVADRRGQGVGRSLMDAIAERARVDGYERLSLSVEPENPAKHLYSRLGYVEHESEDDLGRMILVL